MIPLSKLSPFIEAIRCSDSILWYPSGVVFTTEVPADSVGCCSSAAGFSGAWQCHAQMRAFTVGNKEDYR